MIGEVGRTGLLLRGCVPTLATVLLLLLAALPWALPHGGVLLPVCGIVSIYYWSLYRPQQMPLGAAFLLGIFIDLLGGEPLGTMALVLVLVQAVASSQQRALAGKSFAVAWLGYMLISAGAAIVHWIVICVFFVTIVDPTLAIIGHALGVVLYPILTILLVRVHRLMRVYDDGT